MREKIKQESIDWFLTLRSPDSGSADRRRHQQWLEEDIAHREAYEWVCNEWVDFELLEPLGREELAHLNQQHAVSQIRNRNWLYGGIAAAAMVLVGVLIWPVVESRPERFETVKTEQSRMTLGDGSKLQLNTASIVEVAYGPNRREIHLVKGEGYFDVEHNPQRPFIVTAGSSKVIALGTQFSVRLMRAGEVEVTVLDGKVAVLPVDAGETTNGLNAEPVEPSVILERDQRVVIQSSGQVEQVVQVAAANETAWLEGKLVFEGVPLRNVIEEMSRYVPGEIEVAEGVVDQPVSGIFYINSADAMIDLLSEVVPVEGVKETTNRLVLYPTTTAQRQ